ncbi:MAG: DUF4333 domain-containing protein [Lyngbya sp. HA4199-MV5]|nr:DUF4333 domain-containing protein [Lyngbya sp. HA4199-MV5]
MSQSSSFKARARSSGSHTHHVKYGATIAVTVFIALFTGCTRQPQPQAVDNSPSPTTTAVVSPTISPSVTAKSDATKDLEGRLGKAFTESTKIPLDSVDCPAQFDVKAGNRFNCQATSEGQTFAIAVELTNPDGQFQWNTKELLVLSKLEQYIQSRIRDKGGPDVTANCGGKIRVAQPGDTFECKVTGAQGQARSAQIKVKDEQGGVDISLR